MITTYVRMRFGTDMLRYGEPAGVLVGPEVCHSKTTCPQERPGSAPGFCPGDNGSVDGSGSNWKPVANDMANSSAGT
jgi:hypothetical protein